jgi:hypothetical protein
LEDLTSSRGKDKDGIDPVQRSLMNLRGQLQAAEVKVKALEDACAEAEEVLDVIFKFKNYTLIMLRRIFKVLII